MKHEAPQFASKGMMFTARKARLESQPKVWQAESRSALCCWLLCTTMDLHHAIFFVYEQRLKCVQALKVRACAESYIEQNARTDKLRVRMILDISRLFWTWAISWTHFGLKLREAQTQWHTRSKASCSQRCSEWVPTWKFCSWLPCTALDTWPYLNHSILASLCTLGCCRKSWTIPVSDKSTMKATNLWSFLLLEPISQFHNAMKLSNIV